MYKRTAAFSSCLFPVTSFQSPFLHAQLPLSRAISHGMKALSHLAKILSDPNRWSPLVWLSAIGIGPIALALLPWFGRIGPGARLYRGYWYTQWLMWPAILPLGLYVVRRCIRAVCGDVHATTPSGTTPLAQLVVDSGARVEIDQELAAVVLDGASLGLALVISLVLNVCDAWEVLTVFWNAKHGILSKLREQDWSVMFRAGELAAGPYANALFDLLAYISQFIAVALAFWLVVIFFRHNLLFLQRIYIHSVKGRRPSARYAVLSFIDSNHRCFGLVKIRPVFNVQVAFLGFSGLVICASRYANVHLHADQEAALLKLLNVSEFPKNFTENLTAAGESVGRKVLLPDIGQTFLVLGWLLVFLVTLMPVFLKFLPIFHPPRAKGLVDYLGDFIPDESPDRVRLSDEQALDELAGKFTKNSFWPMGDQWARTLFYGVMMIATVVLFPLRPQQGHLFEFGVYLVVVLLFAIGVTGLFFAALKWALSHIDQRLVNKEEK